MSNIVLHTTHATPALKNDTNFINIFLDNLLENYCNKKYVENTIYPNLNFPKLEDLILEAYPSYYIKSVGLLGHKSNTNVLKIYDEHLHHILINSLEHKLSRLFINVSNSVRELTLKNKVPSRCYYDVLNMMSRDTLNQKLLIRSINKLKPHHLYSLIKISNNSILIQPQITSLVYKPNLEAVQQLSQSIKLKNESIFQELNFFDVREAYNSDLVARLAFSFIYYNDNFIKESVTEEFYNRLIEMSKVIVNHIFNKVDKLKADIVKHETKIQLEIEETKKAQEKVIQEYLEERKKSNPIPKVTIKVNEHISDEKQKTYDELKLNYKEIPLSPVEIDRNKPSKGDLKYVFYFIGAAVLSAALEFLIK